MNLYKYMKHSQSKVTETITKTSKVSRSKNHSLVCLLRTRRVCLEGGGQTQGYTKRQTHKQTNEQVNPNQKSKSGDMSRKNVNV